MYYLTTVRILECEISLDNFVFKIEDKFLNHVKLKLSHIIWSFFKVAVISNIIDKKPIWLHYLIFKNA